MTEQPREDGPEGIIVIDKPRGMTSAQVVAKVKRLLRVPKAGHTGTLDPFATGVLVCCLNRATRLAGFLLAAPKGYEAVLKLGVATDTQDATGQVCGQPAPVTAGEAQIRAAFARFTGSFAQEPPAYSALKHRGRPLYQLARAGRPVQKPPRTVTVHALSITAVRLPLVDFRVRCTAGTYVRTLCHDIGRHLGCGGHLHALRRTECSGFGLAQAVGLAELAQAALEGTAAEHIWPMADAMAWMPEWIADADAARRIRQGQPVSLAQLAPGRPASGAADPQGHLKVVDTHRRLVAVLRAGAGGRLEFGCVIPE